MRIVLMGPPGAGKGTQAKRLVEAFGMVHLSSGDIFRAEKASGSPRGKKLAEYMDSGALVPDDVVVSMMADAITNANGQAGLMLDGFPRTTAQAQALDKQLASAKAPLDAVVVITAPDQAIVERVTGRRVCQCGQAYHVKFMPPKQAGVCDACGSALTQRADDTEKVVRDRLTAYNRQTEPVIAYYRTSGGVRMIEVDGAKAPDAVTADLLRALKGA
ncbi:MAG: adenylate kinase [Planctomycetota bacterium]|nr:adenylate kinase [Planctomycetota bacterium]